MLQLLLLLCTCAGATVWWVPVLFFLGSMVIFFLLVLCIYKSTKWVKSVFCPVSQLPSHFKEVRAMVLDWCAPSRTGD